MKYSKIHNSLLIPVDMYHPKWISAQIESIHLVLYYRIYDGIKYAYDNYRTI